MKDYFQNLITERTYSLDRDIKKFVLEVVTYFCMFGDDTEITLVLNKLASNNEAFANLSRDAFHVNEAVLNQLNDHTKNFIIQLADKIKEK